jgi:hypothetical protein
MAQTVTGVTIGTCYGGAVDIMRCSAATDVSIILKSENLLEKMLLQKSQKPL